MKYFKYSILLMFSLLFTSCNSQKVPTVSPIEGEYSIQGWNPGSDFKKKCEYTGTATVKKDKEYFNFTVKILNKDGKNIVKHYEPCIFSPSDKILSLTWTIDKKTEGCDIFYQTKNGFDVDWIYLNDKDGKLGKEIWTKK